MIINSHLAPYERLNGLRLRIKGVDYKVHVYGAYIKYPFHAFKYSGGLEELCCPHSHSFSCLVVGSTFETIKATLDKHLAALDKTEPEKDTLTV